MGVQHPQSGKPPSMLDRLAKPLWKSVFLSLLTFWGLDLLTSSILIHSGYGYLEGNPSVRHFVETPNSATFASFIQNQQYFVPVVIGVFPVVLERAMRSNVYNFAFLIVSVLLLPFCLDRLDLGVSSNVANIIAVNLGYKLPASGNLALMLLEVFDVIWVILLGSYLFQRLKT